MVRVKSVQLDNGMCVCVTQPKTPENSTEKRTMNMRMLVMLSSYCNRRNFRTRKIFVLERSRTFGRYKLSYLEGGVTYTGIMYKAFVCY